MHLVSPDEVAAVLVEPIQGEGGYVVPPAVFHQRLRELTTQHGMLLMVDEVQSGMGRTGKMFAIEHFGVEPDVVDGGQGHRLGPAARRDDGAGRVMDVAAGRACQHVWRQPGVVRGGARDDRAAARRADGECRRGRRAPDGRGCAALQDKHPLIGDVRGKGLMIGVELVRDRQTKERATRARPRRRRGFTRGLLILGAGRNAVRFSPPLVLTQGAGRHRRADLRRVPDRGGEAA